MEDSVTVRETLRDSWERVVQGEGPEVVLLEGEVGIGKTRAVQEFFDELADDDSQHYWRPGLTPSSPPESRDDLEGSRKRVVDENLCPANGPPAWLWFGLPCTRSRMGSVFSDPLAGNLIPQVEFHLTRLRRRVLERKAIWQGAFKVTRGLAGLLFPVASAADAVATIASGARDIQAAADSPPAEDTLELRRLRCRRAFDAFSESVASALPAVVVLDDAHAASDLILDFLTELLVQSSEITAESGRRYFDIAAPASQRSVLIIACAWPHRVEASSAQGIGLGRWLDELRQTGIRLTVERGEAGSLAPLDLEHAEHLLTESLAWMPAAVRSRLLDRIATASGFNPYLLMLYVALAHESFAATGEAAEIPDEWIERLPSSPLEAGRERLRQLSRVARRAVVLGSHLGGSFPLLAVQLGLDDHADATRVQTALESAIEPLGYLVRETFEEWGVGQAPDYLRFVRFADDFVHRFTLQEQARFPWMAERARRAVAEWLGRALEASLHDLEYGPGSKPFPILLWKDLVSRLAGLYLGSLEEESTARDLELEAFCHAVLLKPRPSNVPAHEEPAETRASRQDHRETLRRLVRKEMTIGSPGWCWAAATLARDTLQRGDLEECSALPEVVERIAQLAPRSRLAAGAARTCVLSSHQSGSLIPEQAIRVLQDNLAYPPAALLLSQVQEAAGDLTGAIEALLPLAQFDSLAATRASKLLEAEARLEEAAALLLPFVASQPPLAIRASLLQERFGDLAGATDSLTAVFERDEAAAARFTYLLELQGGSGRALDVLQQSQSTEAPVVIQIARILRDQGDVEGAIQSLLPHAGTHPIAAMRLAELLERHGQIDRAIEVVEPHSHSGPAYAVRYAQLLELKGEVELAVDALRRLASTYTAVAIRYSELLDALGRVDEAIEDLAPIAEKTPAVAIALSNLLERQGEIDRAIEVVEPHSQSGTDCAVRYSQLLEVKGELDLAVDAVRRVAPVDAAAAIRYSELLELQGEPGLAIAAVESHARTNAAAAIRYSAQLAASGNITRALAAVRNVARTDPSVAIHLARLLAEDQEIEDAIEVLEVHSEREAGTAIRLSELLEREATLDRAIDSLRPIARSNSAAALRLSLLLVKRSDRAPRKNQARDDLVQAAKILEDLPHRDADSTIQLSALHERLGDTARALEVLRAPAQSNPVVALSLSELLERLGQPEEALEVLRALAQYPTAAVRLATKLQAQGDASQAVKVLEQLPPHDLMARLRLGLLLESLGDLGRALDEYAQLAPKVPAAAVRLALLTDSRQVRRQERARLKRLLRQGKAGQFTLFTVVALNVWGPEDVFTIFPRGTRLLNQFVEFLSGRIGKGAHGDWKAAGLYLLMVKALQPAFLPIVKKRLRPFVEVHSYCASILAQTIDDRDEYQDLLPALMAHCRGGHKRSLVELGRLALQFDDTETAGEVADLLSEQPELSTGERDLLVDLHELLPAEAQGAGPRFRFLRKHKSRHGATKIWAMERATGDSEPRDRRVALGASEAPDPRHEDHRQDPEEDG